MYTQSKLREALEIKRKRWDTELNKTQDALWIDPPMPLKLYHYTTLAGVRSILESHELWLSDVLCMDDTSDGTYWLKVFQPIVARKSLPAEVKELFRNTKTFGLGQLWDMYITCLSPESDLDEQWEHYADHGMGCALEVSVEGLLHHCDGGKAYGWLPVLYDAAAQIEKATRTVDAAIRLYREESINLSPAESDEYWKLYASFSFLKCGVRFKSPQWAAQREWRVYMTKTDSGAIRSRSRANKTVEYAALPLAPEMVTGIVKGPLCTFRDEGFVELLRAGGHEPNVRTYLGS